MKSLQYKVNLVIFLKDITDPVIIKKPVMADQNYCEVKFLQAYCFLPYRLDPTNFSEGLRILMKNGATSEQIEAFKQQCEEADVST